MSRVEDWSTNPLMHHQAKSKSDVCKIGNIRETGVHRIKFQVPEKTETIKLVNMIMTNTKGE